MGRRSAGGVDESGRGGEEEKGIPPTTHMRACFGSCLTVSSYSLWWLGMSIGDKRKGVWDWEEDATGSGCHRPESPNHLAYQQIKQAI